MPNKKIMILAMALAGLLFIGAASAADIADSDNSTDFIGQDLDSALNDLEVDENNAISTPKTFKDLDDLINNEYKDNVTIHLSENYTFNSTTDSGYERGIKINRGVTIYGNGITIDGANSARIFNVTGNNVEFHDLAFVNANVGLGPGSDSCGAAIYGDSTSINCTFTNNSACAGGAICGQKEGTAINCTFTKNRAGAEGAAIFYVNATRCIFINNIGGLDIHGCFGGAVSYSTTTDCIFINNYIAGDLSSGGAISYGSATNPTFILNDVEDVGGDNDYYMTSIIGVVTSVGRAVLNVYSSVLTCNSSEKLFDLTNDSLTINGVNTRITFSDGVKEVTYYCLSGEEFKVDLMPGVYDATFTALLPTGDKHPNVDSVTKTIKITNGDTFWDLNRTINNNTDSEIALDKNYTFNSTVDSEFTEGIVIDRNLTIDGQVITIDGLNFARIFHANGANVTFKNITFANGRIGGHGGAISFERSGTVINCNFVNNKASVESGAVYFNGVGSVVNCNFVNNSAPDWGGAIRFIGPATITNCNFTNNTVYNSGGAVLVTSNSISMIDCNFNDNQASCGGAVCFITEDSTARFINCNFTDNKAFGGGAVYFCDNVEGNVTNCSFTNNSASLGGAVYYYEGSSVRAINCNFTDNKVTGDESCGGAVYFYKNSESTVENCSFTNNTASWGGAVGCLYGSTDTVTDCSFTNNTASLGGAVYFWSNGNVTNCNFTNNSAGHMGGAVYFNGVGSVTTCNFVNNSGEDGGAIDMDSGTVENCNFTGNNAITGSAIRFFSDSDTITVSNSCFLNNRANAKALEVTKNDNNITISFIGEDNLLNAIYSNNDVTFTDVTYWSADGIANTGSSAVKPSRSNKEAGQNITVGIVVNGEIVLSEVYPTDEDGMIVLDISAGDNYFIGARHDTDSYYTEKVQIISNNTKFNVNVTSQTANNRTVNITAKSNIPNEVIKGKLLFILPNGTEINATYAGNGTWWAVHTFDNAGDYNVSASYIGLDNVTVNNATISIRYDASVDVNNRTLDLLIGDTFTIVATTTPEGLNVSYVPDDSGVYSVDENGKITALRDGEGSIWVKIRGDGVYAENSTIVNVTVSKVPTEITVLNDTLVLAVGDEVTSGAALTPADAGNLTYTVSNSSVVKVEDGNIIALAEGKATITVSFEGDKKYLDAENKTINVTVHLKDVRISVNNRTLDLFVGDTFAIVATTVPEGLNVTFVPDNSGVVSVDKNGVVTALKEGSANIAVKVGDGKTYAFNSTTVTVTVSKVPTEINVNPDSLDLFVGDETVIVASLTPADVGNVTFKSSDDSVVIVDDQGNVIANGKGQANITVSFTGDDKYAAAEKTVAVDVSLNDASVTVDKDALDLKVGERYAINATRHPDTILLEITYKSSDNSVATVDENGGVVAVGEGTATITLSVGDGEIYAENSTNITVTVKKSTPKLTAKSKSFKDTDKAKRYAVVLKDNTGKPIKKVKVYLKVNGRIYAALTNNNGKAIFKLTKLTKKGTYNALIVYKGDSKYNKVGKKVKIAVKTSFKTVGPGSKDKTTVKKIQKALKNKGYYLTYKGRYLMIDGYYGSCTQRSVKEFQSANGLKVTGKVDYSTAKKLGII